jgi:dTDP-4-amino-4,6-dideoxygalactose transaminase
VVRRTLGRLDAEASVRRANAAALAAAFGPDAGIPTGATGATPGWLRLPLVAANPARGRSPAARRLGIAPGYPQSLADLESFGPRARVEGETYPGARRLAANLLTLPTHSRLSAGDLRAVIEFLGRGPHAE